MHILIRDTVAVVTTYYLVLTSYYISAFVNKNYY